MSRTSLKLINPDIPGASPFKRWNDSCHFAATWDTNALVAISTNRIGGDKGIKIDL